jgi:hypothetical protein
MFRVNTVPDRTRALPGRPSVRVFPIRGLLPVVQRVMNAADVPGTTWRSTDAVLYLLEACRLSDWVRYAGTSRSHAAGH